MTSVGSAKQGHDLNLHESRCSKEYRLGLELDSPKLSLLHFTFMSQCHF